MLYSLCADLTVVIHVMFVLFVVCGGLAVSRRPWLAWLHLPAAVWGAAIEFGGWVCPLTYLENRLRRLGGEAGYAGACIEHYLEQVLYPLGLTARAQTVLGLLALAINLAVYFRLWWRWFRRPG